MSIFIKGMKMPRNCESCSVAYLAECELWMTAGYRQRHKDCPLVEVPTSHGRLVDIEAVYKEITNYYKQRTELQHIALQECLSRVPTIIEAEGE